MDPRRIGLGGVADTWGRVGALAWVVVLGVVVLTAACARPDSDGGTPVASVSAGDLLDRAIAFHDPAGEWPTLQLLLELEEDRPDGESRHTTHEPSRPTASNALVTPSAANAAKPSA